MDTQKNTDATLVLGMLLAYNIHIVLIGARHGLIDHAAMPSLGRLHVVISQCAML